MFDALSDFIIFCRVERRLSELTCKAYERDVRACVEYSRLGCFGASLVREGRSGPTLVVRELWRAARSAARRWEARYAIGRRG
jgi:site-specific recombinase XerC